jgi:hypothetical protein
MFAGLAALATAATASAAHLTDSQYIAAAHCQGLFDSHALGAADAHGINSLMKTESLYRGPEILDRADEARSEAKGEANRAGSLMKSQLVSERDGACQTWAKAGEIASGR